MAAKEKRRSARKKHDSVLELFDDSGSLIAGIGRLVNVSKTGVCFSTQKKLAQGERIYARLRLLKEGLLEVTGRVIWTRQNNNRTLYGVEFDSAKAARRR